MMTDREITIHIGASKCGSSALQAAFSAVPTIKRNDGTELNYVAFDAVRSQLIKKNRLTQSRGVSGYRSSPNAKVLLQADLDKLRTEIATYPSEILFSSESWLFQPREWNELLHRLNVRARVVVYVRPQVPVLNSAWWQWGAWSDQDFDSWIAQRLKASLWATKIEPWLRLERVSDVIVRPVPQDIVTDFYANVLKAEVPDNIGRPNPSLPGSVLRLFQRNRSLRPSAHKSKIDFALSSVLSSGEPTIWVLNNHWIERIIEEARSDNKRLLRLMDPASATSMRNDQRWWNADAFVKEIAEPPEPQEIPSEKLERLCVEMAQAIFELKSK